MTILPGRHVGLRLSEDDAKALSVIARRLADQGATIVTLSEVLRYALKVAAESRG